MSQRSTTSLGSEEPVAAFQANRILVAEDLSTVREIARAMLVKAGFVVDLAANGAEAVALAANRRYDLILMDVNMPTVDGVAATGMIRDLDEPHRSVPIVAMTAERSPARLQRILESGMNAHICKPFGRADLLDAIRPWVT